MTALAMNKHLIELVAPRQNSQDLETDMNKFSERYRLFLDNDMVICITDNPMGHLSFMGPEIVDVLELPVKAGNIMVHLNTFHRKMDEGYDPKREQNEQDLDIIIQHAHTLGIKYLLCVSGDGSETLPRLDPHALGYDGKTIQTVTSVQLLEYIHKEYSGQFVCGVAFNQYEPAGEELEKLKRKLGAGAAFIITQPVSVNGESDERIVTANKNLENMLRFADTNHVQVILEVWMSQKLAHLMPECIGYDIQFGDFDPWANIQAVHRRYPEQKLYLSMIFGPKALNQVQETLAHI